jgi:hypothetical protein
MKKSKIFMISGAAILAISAVFATRANKKFTALSTAFAEGSLKIQYSSALFTSASGTGYKIPYVRLYTAQGAYLIGNATAPQQLKTAVNGSDVIYLKSTAF